MPTVPPAIVQVIERHTSLDFANLLRLAVAQHAQIVAWQKLRDHGPGCNLCSIGAGRSCETANAMINEYLQAERITFSRMLDIMPRAWFGLLNDWPEYCCGADLAGLACLNVVENPGDMCDGCKAENRTQWTAATK